MADISGISPVNYRQQLANINQVTASQTTASKKQSFSTYLGEALSSLQTSMNGLNQDTTNTISGKQNDLGSLMINMTETQLRLETAVQVRNKVLDAYNDIKNMQF